MLFSNTRVLLKWPCNYSSLNSLLWIWMFGKATQSYLTVQISCDFFLVLGRFLAFILVQPMIDQVLHSYLSFLAGSRVYHLDAACHALLYLINPARKHCVTLDFADRSWIKKAFMVLSHLGKTVGEDCSTTKIYCDCVQWTCNLVAVEMAALKTGTRLATSCNQLPSSKW